MYLHLVQSPYYLCLKGKAGMPGDDGRWAFVLPRFFWVSWVYGTGDGGRRSDDGGGSSSGTTDLCTTPSGSAILLIDEPRRTC